MLSYSHSQLLKSMLEYEIKNFINPEIARIKEGQKSIGSAEFAEMMTARDYLEKRIKQLAA